MTPRFFLFGCLLVAGYSAAAQKQYNCKLILRFNDTLSGLVNVDLNGPNKEMITFTEITGEGSQGGNQVTESPVKINSGIVYALIINGKRYKFKDLKNGYKDADIVRNCCVKLVAGTDSLGLFEFKNEKGIASYYIQTPKDGYQLYNIEHPYVTGDFKSFSLLRFVKCGFLEQNIAQKDPSYYYAERGNTLEEKVKVWKNIIVAYYYKCDAK